MRSDSKDSAFTPYDVLLIDFGKNVGNYYEK
jgi:hypothetical protein